MVKADGGVHPVGKRLRCPAVGVSASAENDGDVCAAAVVGGAEEKHLGQGKGDDQCRERRDKGRGVPL